MIHLLITNGLLTLKAWHYGRLGQTKGFGGRFQSFQDEAASLSSFKTLQVPKNSIKLQYIFIKTNFLGVFLIYFSVESHPAGFFLRILPKKAVLS